MKKKATEIVFGVLGTAAPRALIEAVAEAMADVASAANARAETAERDLAALRRRVEEACREDTNHVAWVRARIATMPVHSTWAGFAPVLEALDHARAAAGELRGMLREARGLTLGPDHAADVGLRRSACDEFTNRPGVLAAIKEPGT